MKTVLCYGDSNTWGCDPNDCSRYAPDVRWTGMLQAELGRRYRVIEEGLCGRTTVLDDPIEGAHKNGRTYFLPCLDTHQPLDCVVIMLGTNDLKARFSMPSEDIARGAGVLAGIALNGAFGPLPARGSGLVPGAPEVLLVAPAVVKGQTAFGEMFEGAEEKSKRFAEHYRIVAEECGCHFLDAGSVVESSPVDGIHLDKSEHLKLGMVLAEKVRGMLRSGVREDVA